MSTYLTSASVLQCPHGASVTGNPSQSEQVRDGHPLLSDADTFLVHGCPFVDSAGTPNPCLHVTWTTAADLAVGWGHALDETSTGIALDAAGTPLGPVVIVLP